LEKEKREGICAREAPDLRAQQRSKKNFREYKNSGNGPRPGRSFREERGGPGVEKAAIRKGDEFKQESHEKTTYLTPGIRTRVSTRGPAKKGYLRKERGRANKVVA